MTASLTMISSIEMKIAPSLKAVYEVVEDVDTLYIKYFMLFYIIKKASCPALNVFTTE